LITCKRKKAVAFTNQDELQKVKKKSKLITLLKSLMKLSRTKALKKLIP
jgi:hypothetical protein